MSANDDVVDYTGKVIRGDDIKRCIEELRKLILEDNTVQKIRVDEDAYLLRFLYCTNFDVPLAFKRVQEWHNLVLENPDWFVMNSLADRKKHVKSKVKALLKCRDRKGRIIFIDRIGKLDTQNSSAREEALMNEMWYEAAMKDPRTVANGISVIMDMKGYSWKLFKWFIPSNIMIGSKTTELLPCKDIIYHVVNTTFWVNAGLKMAWPFMSENTQKRMKLHFEDWAALHEYISPDVLPPEFGGTGPEIEFDKLNEWFLAQESDIRKKLDYRPTASK